MGFNGCSYPSREYYCYTLWCDRRLMSAGDSLLGGRENDIINSRMHTFKNAAQIFRPIITSSTLQWGNKGNTVVLHFLISKCVFNPPHFYSKYEKKQELLCLLLIYYFITAVWYMWGELFISKKSSKKPLCPPNPSRLQCLLGRFWAPALCFTPMYVKEPFIFVRV